MIPVDGVTCLSAGCRVMGIEMGQCWPLQEYVRNMFMPTGDTDEAGRADTLLPRHFQWQAGGRTYFLVAICFGGKGDRGNGS